MVSLDRKDAYPHVPICPSYWRYLRVVLRDVEQYLIVYQWKVLSFGLATAPREFTKLLAPVAPHLHLWGCLMYSYIDGIYHAEVSLHQVSHAWGLSFHCHVSLGFVVSLTKSDLVPSKVNYAPQREAWEPGLIFPGAQPTEQSQRVPKWQIGE